MKTIKTKYLHEFDAQGARLKEPCGGRMEICSDTEGVYACCSRCGNGFRITCTPGMAAGGLLSAPDVSGDASISPCYRHVPKSLKRRA